MAGRCQVIASGSCLCHHQTHVEWVGCSLHDLIQPSFSFLVGVALPFSIASRLARGQSKARMTAHALWRSLVLVFLGVFLRSLNSSQTNFTFEDTLSQIGLGYTFLFVLALYSRRVQWVALALILDRILGGLRPLSACPVRISSTRRSACQRTGRTTLAGSRALGQEQQPGLGIRHVVPESVSPAEARSRTTAAATRR